MVQASVSWAISSFGLVTDERTNDFAISYRKETEKASPGYYTVELKNKVKTELTATERWPFINILIPSESETAD